MNSNRSGKRFDKPYELFSKEEASQNFEWFVANIPNAIRLLTEEIRKYPGNEDWMPDYSTASINAISEWIFKTAYFIETPLEEVEQLISKNNYPPHIASSLRNNRNRFSPELNIICEHTGVYIGEAIRHHVETLQWICKKKPKSDLHFNQPVLTNPEGTLCYPAYIIIANTAYNMTEGKYGKEGILETYQRWYSLFKEGPALLRQELLDKTPEKFKKHIQI
jgi:hypothetical protein